MEFPLFAGREHQLARSPSLRWPWSKTNGSLREPPSAKAPPGRGEQSEIGIVRLGMRPAASLNHLLKHIGHVPKRLIAVGQIEVPSPVVCHGARLIEIVGIGADPTSTATTQDPLLLEPGHVPDLPEQRIDDLQAGAQELSVIEVRNQLQRHLKPARYQVRRSVRHVRIVGVELGDESPRADEYERDGQLPRAAIRHAPNLRTRAAAPRDGDEPAHGTALHPRLIPERRDLRQEVQTRAKAIERSGETELA
jgi:hypothetical protein